MIEPYEGHDHAPEMLYFLGQAYGNYNEKLDARRKVETAISALKQIGSIALRKKVEVLEEQLITSIKKEKDIPLVLEKKSQVAKHYKESIKRIDQEIEQYIKAKARKARKHHTEERVLQKQEMQKRIERAEHLIQSAKAKGMDKTVELLEVRIDRLKMHLDKL
ncbi:MAG: hypothetical protein QF486_00785 [Candidatus Woesearchaeota archaeon]|jgi:hypothetical protein|nr:hypothetical protein [Candidatus Woesearchaeota archaeon]MDP7181244.1 hypothetical protein [Candidatus Woesearchaeota archaeon]MDP7198137.1 hypothetical protein [Candidatus Woesearchaeota archaeon]MDP7466971.1 hypothetical protein [Candidatus Woesearchaeota archaeon]MDP7646943.1 hypothetical protein [Candidatus Woesearchaeota archaeon]|tara:strand:- start:38 stop:526 length:489 start_codon:yes stop_codon:yes gene_type:complete